MPEPLIGLICDHSSPILAGDIARAGYQVRRILVQDLPPDRSAILREKPVDTWVVDCVDPAAMESLLPLLDAPVLALDERPDPSDSHSYRHWRDRILSTLERWTATARHQVAETTSSPAAWREVADVWLLAGSTGALGAVSEFLAGLVQPPPLAFVYAQHIDATREHMLMTIERANPALHCILGLGRHWLNPRQLLIAPASRQLKFARGGEVYSSRESWAPPDTPNFDQLMLSISGIRPAGAILFSGTGTFGRDGLAALAQLGTDIWVQDPASCDAPSMPATVIEAGLATTADRPAGLARRLARRYA